MKHIYLLISPDLKTVVAQLNVYDSKCPRYEAEKHWFEQLKSGFKISSFLDITDRDMERIEKSINDPNYVYNLK